MIFVFHYHHLGKPEPELLKDVSWELLWPLSILCVQSGFTSSNVCIDRADPTCSLEDLPEPVEHEEDWYADIGGKEVSYTPMRMVFTNEHIKSVEDDDQGKVDQSKPCGIWLEATLEDKSVSVNTLCLECLVELEICDTDRAPGEERSDGGQVLEPVEDNRWPTRFDGQICEESNRGCDEHAVIRDTGLAASEKEARGLFVLSEGEQVTRSGIQECIGRGRS